MLFTPHIPYHIEGQIDALDADRRAREIGARSVIRKPLDLDEVRQALRAIGCCQARPRRTAAPPERGAATLG